MLTTAAYVIAFALAAWALLCAAINRQPDRIQFYGAILATLSIVALLIQAVVQWHPQDPIIFIGYGLTALLLPGAAWALARLEPTRYGSLIVGVAALIQPVLVLRMGQVWGVS
ncbi:hypothetical protein [Allorhizocola rhizosphaerae]|uniref:hypothetical protein n=1 Tax=Allorhizocola rhizosphaerae TaxID=1872709 RepID=UPI000E3CF94B|nr:hypothetical protein [Allorhizocola rhizosphaerae]